MSATSIHGLRTHFRKAFPEYARQLDSAKSHAELQQRQQEILSRARLSLVQALKTRGRLSRNTVRLYF